MSRTWVRVGGGLLAAVMLWVVAYWWINSARTREPKVSLSDRVATAPSTPVLRATPNSGLATPDLLNAAPRSTSAVPESAPAPIDPKPQPLATTPPETPAQPPRTAAVTPPKFTDYTIKRGDSLSTIAARQLGSAGHVDAIRRSNPLKDLDRIKEGDVIRLPVDPTNIQGKPVEGAPPPTPPAERQGELLEYTVKNGDTLSKIAQDKYGSATYQDLIYNANRDRLPSRNSLKEGQKLRLPRKPGS